MRIVAALDGELLVAQDATLGIQGQREAITNIVEKLGGLVQDGHELVITHGNGPQVGFMLMRAEMASHAVHPVPLDVCGADTQGATGYLLQQAWGNWLKEHNVSREVSTLITQVLVADPNPVQSGQVKGVGPFFDLERVHAYENSRGWRFVLVPGRGYQRVVPTVLPCGIIETNAIKHLLALGYVVICAGGGGVPVKMDEHGRLEGVEAVVDKAYTAALLALAIEAEVIMFVSPRERIERVFTHSGLDGVTCLSLSLLNELLDRQASLEYSIKSKLVASRKFLQEGGKSVLLVSPEQLNADSYPGWGVRLVADNLLGVQLQD